MAKLFNQITSIRYATSSKKFTPFLISCYFLFLTQVCTFLHSETSVKIVLFILSNRKQTDLGFSTQIESFYRFSVLFMKSVNYQIWSNNRAGINTVSNLAKNRICFRMSNFITLTRQVTLCQCLTTLAWHNKLNSITVYPSLEKLSSSLPKSKTAEIIKSESYTKCGTKIPPQGIRRKTRG